MVLATDMKQHFAIHSMFQVRHRGTQRQQLAWAIKHVAKGRMFS
jgi:hypothetical protein